MSIATDPEATRSNVSVMFKDLMRRPSRSPITAATW